jgi:hypothetical protein
MESNIDPKKRSSDRPYHFWIKCRFCQSKRRENDVVLQIQTLKGKHILL